MTKLYSLRILRHFFFIFTAIVALSVSNFVSATIVEFETSQGNFQVNLFDQTTPKTVANFLQYIDENHYTNSVIHRVEPNFVMQGGGFSFEGSWPSLTPKATNAAVINEPVYSNIKGTIAMAKLGGNPNSATDQWFFNLSNNSSNLDVQNGGFTVFGQVIGEGMTVVEKIATLSLCRSIPMVNYSSQNCTDKTVPGLENFVVIYQIVIVDSSAVTDASLNPAKNTLINKSRSSRPSSGGGSLGWLSLMLLVLTGMVKIYRKS